MNITVSPSGPLRACSASQVLTSWARTYCQRSSSRQGGAKDQEKKKRSEGPVRQFSRYELSENVIICSYFDYFECSTLESISFNFLTLSPFPEKKNGQQKIILCTCTTRTKSKTTPRGRRQGLASEIARVGWEAGGAGVGGVGGGGGVGGCLDPKVRTTLGSPGFEPGRKMAKK